MTTALPERVGLQQRVVPAYRAPFFDALSAVLPGGLSVFAGQPGRGEGILPAEKLAQARWVPAVNRRLGMGRAALLYQQGWRRWLADENPRTVVLEANPRYLSNWLILQAMRKLGRPVLGWSLGPAGNRSWVRWMLRPMYARFAGLIVYSRTGADGFQRLGIPPDRIFVAPNAVESKTADSLLRLPAERGKARRDLRLDERPLVLFVGRLQTRKRVDLLIRACARCGVPCRLCVVGDGPDLLRLKRIAAEWLPETIFPGDVRGEELGRFFLAADLFVLPGTGGLALQEALLYGKAVAVAEADGSQRDLVREGENGWLLSPGDETRLLEVLRNALAAPDRLQAMGETSRRLVRETATLEKMVGGFLDAFRYAAAIAGSEGKP